MSDDAQTLQTTISLQPSLADSHSRFEIGFSQPMVKSSLKSNHFDISAFLICVIKHICFFLVSFPL